MAGHDDHFQFELSLATAADLEGGFTTTHGATVYVMTPGNFTIFSSPGVTKFQCSNAQGCFTTSEVTTGKVSIPFLPVYETHQGIADPWFLVMQNSNATTATDVTWTSNLVASYIDITG
jgi:hypothetical protein